MTDTIPAYDINQEEAAVTPNFGDHGDAVAKAVEAHFTPGEPAVVADEAAQRIQANIAAPADDAAVHAMEIAAAEEEAGESAGESAGVAAAAQETEEAYDYDYDEFVGALMGEQDGAGAAPKQDDCEEGGDADADAVARTEAPVAITADDDVYQKGEAVTAPAEPAQYSPMIGRAYKEKRKSNLTAEEELVWWQLYMQSSSRLEAHSGAPQNVWTAEERRLIESISSAALEEMQGRLLTLLSGVEYSLWWRATHEGNTESQSRGDVVGRHTVSSRPAHGTSSRASSVVASHLPAAAARGSQVRVDCTRPASTTADATSEKNANVTGSRRRVMARDDVIMRSNLYTPRRSASMSTPVMGEPVFLNGSRRSGGLRTPRTSIQPSHALQHNPQQQQEVQQAREGDDSSTPSSSHPLVSRRAGNCDSTVMRGSRVSRTDAHAPICFQGVRQPFSTSLNNSRHSLRGSRLGTSMRSSSSGIRQPRTPRSVRKDLNNTPEPLQMVPPKVQTRRLETTNPVRREVYTPRHKH